MRYFPKAGKAMSIQGYGTSSATQLSKSADLAGNLYFSLQGLLYYLSATVYLTTYPIIYKNNPCFAPIISRSSGNQTCKFINKIKI